MVRSIGHWGLAGTCELAGAVCAGKPGVVADTV